MSCHKTKNIEAALSKKGFRENNGTRHKLYRYYNGEEKTEIATFISYGMKEYCDHLLAAMRRQLCLSDDEFTEFVKCPMTKEKLHEIYLEKKLIKK
jgi:hypothetical protein